MRLPIYHLDSFALRLFGGNPAAVCILEKWLPDARLQAIAAENHLPATTFLVRQEQQFFTRWFTPEYEIDLCGHGTLALGHVIFKILEPTLEEVELQSPAGALRIRREGKRITLDFPVKAFHAPDLAGAQLQEQLTQGLGLEPKEIYCHKKERCLVIFQTEEEIQKLQPDLALLKKLDFRGLIVSAPGKTSDFVSRVFYPQKQLWEDAVTGSSHCLLVPYWAERLNKKTLHSRQLSQRGGDLHCELADARVYLSGEAILYLEGHIYLDE